MLSVSYLSQEVLNGFSTYKYNAKDTSPVSKYITHPFWNWTVQFCPRRIAPNVLTLSGFLFLILNFVLLTIYDCEFYSSSYAVPSHPPVPDWVWFISGICLFMAHTLDGIDGKQARRTGTSGPLGELFDHGLDSWAVVFQPLGAVSLFGVLDYGLNPFRVLLLYIGMAFMFHLSHWEKYNTGVLYLPWTYDISQISITALYFVTYFYTIDIWKTSISFLGLTFAQFLEVIIYFGIIFLSIPVSVYNVLKSYQNGSGKMLPVYESIRPLYAITVCFFLFICWALISPNDILSNHPRLFIVSCGVIFSNISCRQIVNGMSNTRCQAFNWMLIPLIFLNFSLYFFQSTFVLYEYFLLWALTLMAVISHLHYGICVVNQLSNHLSIYAFSVEKRQKGKTN